MTESNIVPPAAAQQGVAAENKPAPAQGTVIPIENDAASEKSTVAYMRVADAIQAGSSGNWQLAEKLYAEAYRLDNTNARATNGLAIACSGQDKPDEALKWYKQTLDLYDRKIGNANWESALIAHNGMAKVFYNMGEWNASLAEFEKSRAIDGKNPITLEGMALVHLQTGNDDEAKKYFQMVADIQPSNAFAQANLSAFAEKEGKNPIALQYMKKATELEPVNDNYAASFARLGSQVKGAIQER
jgi:tetratricopeptide (TPR) repeat protein